MSSPVEQNIIRIGFDLARSADARTTEAGATNPLIWRGTTVRFQVALLNDEAIIDVSNLSSVTLEVFATNDLGGTLLMTKTVAAGSLDNTVTDANWSDGTHQHANFDFTDTETNLTSPGNTEGSTWEESLFLVVSGVTTGGSKLTYGWALLKFREDGTGSAGSPPTNDPNYYTKGESDARFPNVTGGTMTADPTVALGIATKQYVDAATSNGSWKIPVRVASTANITISAPGSTIDAVTLANGDRVLLKDQSTASQNGIYTFNGSAAAMTRSSDANTSGLMKAGVRVAVNEGTANAKRTFALTTVDPITLGTTSLTFTQTSALGQVTLPAGLTKTSNEVAAWDAATHATPAGIDVTTAGSAAAPAYSRNGDTNTGRFFPAADTIADAVGGAEITRQTSTGLGVLKTPAVPLDVAGEAAFSSRVVATGFQTDTPGVFVEDVAVAAIASNNLPFPDNGNILSVAAGTVNTVSNVRAGAVYQINATGAVTLTNGASIVCRNGGNVVLAAGETVTVLGLSPTSISVIGSTIRHRVADGTSAAPSIFFDSETDMGLFRSAAGLIGVAFSGIERLKLGKSGSDILVALPTYNLNIDPQATTGGQGNIGFFSPTDYCSAAGVFAMPMLSDTSGVAPTTTTEENVLWWGDYDNAAGPALWIATGAKKHLIGENYVNFFATDQSFTFGVKANTIGFYNDAGLQYTTFGAHSDIAAVYPNHILRRSRNTLASPNSVQSGDQLSRRDVQGYGGSAYQTAWREDVVTDEAFSGTAAGAHIVWSSCPLGSNTLTERLRLDSAGNWRYHGATAPASLAKGIVIADGTAPSADPTNAVALWSGAGAPQYRSATSGEGYGQTNYLHNRTSEVDGTGTNYTLTASNAHTVFGTTSPDITLPTAGTYVIDAIVQVLADAAGAGDQIHANIYNATDSSGIGNAGIISCAGNSYYQQIHLRGVVTVTASKSIQIWAYNATSARGSIVSTGTSIRYTRMS